MKKPVLLALVAVVAAGSLWSYRRGAAPNAPDEAAGRLVTDRIWIDHVPRDERDTIHVFAAASKRALGVFRATSRWRGSAELFRFEASGGELRVVYPQTGERETVRARARRCTEQRMDFCLELDGASRGVKRYYSRKGWEIDGAPSPREIRARVDAVLQAK